MCISFSACSGDKFACANKKCIPTTWKCDHFDDCGDASDEMNCTYSVCSSPNFRFVFIAV